MKQLNWYQIFGNTHKIPDGATVLPTDDIQIWLHCANIWDKTYTTLAEVLADTTTLLALINSNNAVDYMVRSITWAGNLALVPVMTSNTTPSGQCIGDTPSSSVRALYKAFDGDSSTFYNSIDTSANQGNIGYEFPVATKINYATAYVYNNTSAANPTTIVLQSSDDGVTFTDISSAVTHTLVASGYQTFEFNASNVSSKKYYRLHRTAGNDRFWLNSIQFGFSGIVNNSTAMSYIGLNNYCANTLLVDSTWCEAICNSEYFESVLNVKVPVMTSNTTPSGECFASFTQITNREYYKAFTPDGGDGAATSLTSGSSYIGYGFENAAKIYKFMGEIYNAAGISSISTSFTVDSSNDKSTWNELASGSTTYGVGSNPHDFDINFIPSSPARYYRLYISNTRNTMYRYFQFYGREDI